MCVSAADLVTEADKAVERMVHERPTTRFPHFECVCFLQMFYCFFFTIAVAVASPATIINGAL